MIKEIDALDLQVSRLSYAHNNGAYNPLTTKVLELKLNPDTEEYAIRTSTLERLRDENNALLERVAVLEKGKGGSDESSDALVPRESLTSLRKEFEDLQGVIEQKEKMNLRLLDVCYPFSLHAWSKLSTNNNTINRRTQRKRTNSVKPSSPYSVIDSTFPLRVKSAFYPCTPRRNINPLLSLLLRAILV